MRKALRPVNLLTVCSILTVAGLAMPALGQTNVVTQATAATPSKTSSRLTARKVSASGSTLRDFASRAKQQNAAEQHPLWPALELAVDSYKHIRKNVRDYSCGIVRQERVDGRLQAAEYMTAKVRHQRSINGKVAVPFGVYLKVHAPTSVKGREVLYVDGQNDGDMIVRNGGKRFAFVTATIKPSSDRAMRGNRYPLTEFGFENLVKRLIEVVKEDIRFNVNTKVEFFENASLNGRSCTGIRVTHPDFDARLRFHTATVFMDNELNVPVHYEAHGWSKEEGQEPPLLEKYTYRDIKLNVGYTESDFDRANPDYKLK